MNNIIKAYFSVDPEQGYPIVNNFTYTDNFNEELDSMNIIIDGVDEEHRLNFEEPYVFVKLWAFNTANSFKWSESYVENGKLKKRLVNYKFMLLDTWVETEQNGIYKYEITLMSFTKILEKIQCPSLMITHSLTSGQKTIYEYIDQYMKLYCPKVKVRNGNNWSYEYLFTWSDLNIDPFNTTNCADLQFNEPTLRELLTTLMLQVDCIPMMEYRNLLFINFKENNTQFVKSNTTFITESGASDSFNTSLTVSPSQILDSDNVVISENIGFRDRDNVLISQTKNLQLETRFPIYNVKKCFLKYGLVTNFYPCPQNQNSDLDIGYPVIFTYDKNSQTHYYDNFCNIIEDNDYKLRVRFTYYNTERQNAYWDTGILRNIKFHYCQWDSANNRYNELYEVPVNQQWYLNLDVDDAGENPYPNRVTQRGATVQVDELNMDGSISTYSASPTPGENNYYYQLTIGFPWPPDNSWNDNVYIWMEYDFYDNYENKNYHCVIPMRCRLKINNNLAEIYTPQYYSYDANNVGKEYNENIPLINTHGSSTYNYTNLPGLNYGVDITPLIVENKKRSLKDTDYAAYDTLVNSYTGNITDLAKYVYGTMGYNIGDTKITGFSETYSKAQWWWSKTTSYFDSILKFINNHRFLIKANADWDNKAAHDALVNLSTRFAGFPFNENTLDPDTIGAFVQDDAKGKYSFDITYQALNSFKLKIPKENKDIPLDLTVLSNSESGLSDFNRYIRNTQSMSNRMGNKVVQIPQTTDDFSKIQSLNSILDGKIIFKRVMSISDSYITVLYTAAEKYVLQNYFTSIITKYRAYEYVDYEQSIIRKENTCIYCLLSDDYNFDGCISPYIYWKNGYNKSVLLDALDYDREFYNPLKYLVRQSNGLDKDNNVINNQRTKEALSVITYDDGFAIITQEFDNVSAGLSLLDLDLTTGSLGGARQNWQIWDNVYYNYHRLSYTTDLLYNSTRENSFNSLINFPVLDIYVNSLSATIFELAENNGVDTDYKYYYKDRAEVINQTVQFHFYSEKTNDILFNENLFRYNSLINTGELLSKQSFNNMFVRLTNNFSLHPDIYYEEHANVYTESDVEDFYEVTSDGIQINWSLINYECIVIGKALGADFYNDLIVFKKNGRNTDTLYYLSLNNNQSQTVWEWLNDDDDYDGLYLARDINFFN